MGFRLLFISRISYLWWVFVCCSFHFYLVSQWYKFLEINFYHCERKLYDQWSIFNSVIDIKAPTFYREHFVAKKWVYVMLNFRRYICKWENAANRVLQHFITHSDGSNLQQKTYSLVVCSSTHLDWGWNTFDSWKIERK